MPKGENNGRKMWALAQIMYEKTDKDHALTCKQITKYLADYNIKVGIKSLYPPMERLSEMGLNIVKKKIGRENYYYLETRLFELAEVKLLIDACQSCRFISEEKTNEIIRKLEILVSNHDKKKLRRQLYPVGRVKMHAEDIYRNIDVIHEAVANNRKLNFQYWQWDLKKRKILKYGGDYYSVSPAGLVWKNEYYYMIGFDDREKKIKYYRIDKMINVTEKAEKREGIPANFDIASYAEKSFSMFGGTDTVVKIRAKNSHAGVFIDQCGQDVVIRPEDKEHFIVRVKVQMSPHFIGWLLALGEGVEVIGPKSARDEIKAILKRWNSIYG